MPLPTPIIVVLVLGVVGILTGVIVVTVLELRSHHRHHRVAVTVDVSERRRPIPNNLFGINIEDGNHGVTGGLWAEMLPNRGFEAGGSHDISPWVVIGDESTILVSIDYDSCFKKNKAALKMQINAKPATRVGVYNPGFWGMPLSVGESYKVIFYLRSEKPMPVMAAFTTSNGYEDLARRVVWSSSNWTRQEFLLHSSLTDPNARFQLTVTKNGTIWFDQVSVMPLSSYDHNGFRRDIFQMMVDLKPGFLRFPGGSYVEGKSLHNSFKWKETVGSWEERPGHYNDAWGYWTDDGLGFYEYLLLASKLLAAPVWVVNCGISLDEQLNSSDARIRHYIQDVLDGIQFATGPTSTIWGGLRSDMGSSMPFDLKYITIGSDNCHARSYEGNYMEFYNAVKQAYPDIQVISNCGAFSSRMQQPADMFESEVLLDSHAMYASTHMFDGTLRSGPKAFVSQYAAQVDGRSGKDLESALSEAALLLGVEKNSDVVAMASYATLLGNSNDGGFYPQALILNSSHVYGTPSYWAQRFFAHYEEADLLNLAMKDNEKFALIATAIRWNKKTSSSNITVKFLNFENSVIRLDISFVFDRNSTLSLIANTVLNSSSLKDENSFEEPSKVSSFSTTEPLDELSANRMKVELLPFSLSKYEFMQTVV